MLMVNPAAGASLREVLSHPWMICGHGGPPDPHMLHREVLRVGDIDMNVVQDIAGFGWDRPRDIS